MLELHHLLGAMGDKIIDRILLAKPIAAGNRVVEMMLKTVVRLYHAGGPAFGSDRVAAHRIDLRDQRDSQRWIRLGHGDGCAQACAPGAHNRNVRLEYIHSSTPLAATGIVARLARGAAPIPDVSGIFCPLPATRFDLNH
jgi:hypothetical protein